MIDFDGSKELMYEFPKEFQVRQNGKTYPYYKLANNKIRFMDEVPSAGQLDIVEVLSKQAPVRSSLVHTIADLAFMTKDDVNKIDDTAARLKVQAGELEQTLKVSQDLLGDITAYENANKADIDELKADTARGFSSVAQGLADVNTKVDNARNEALINASELSAQIKAHETATNPHKISKKMLGIDKVDNTSDADKPISKATQEALDLKADKEDLSKIEDKLEKTSKKQEELVNGLSSFGAAVAEALPSQKGKSGKYLKTDGKKAYWAEASGGGGGTSDYTDLENKPQINGTTLSGNKTSSDLGLQAEIDSDHKLSASLVDGLASVATSGAYSDLTGTPSLATVATSGSYSDLTDKPTIPTVDQTYDSTSANAQSGVAVASAVSGKQDTLVSGTNIKTINNESLLGSGNIDIGGGGGASSLTDIAVAGDNVTFTLPPFGELNATVVGSPTISSSFVASGFSDSNYLTTTDILNNTTTSFEVVVPFMPKYNATTNCSLIDKEQVNSRSSFRLEQTSNLVQCRLSDAPSTYNYFATLTGTTHMTYNQKYWVKVTYDSVEGYKLFLSSDGETWNLEASTALTNLINTDLNTPLRIGDNSVSGSSFTGDIYLDGTYISVNNGEYEWHAVNQETTKIKINATDTLPSQTGNSGKFLTTNGTTASWGNALANTASGSNALAILGSAASNYAHAIGRNTESGTASVSVGYYAKGYMSNTVAVGYYSKCSGNYGVALGSGATSSNTYAVAIGAGSYAYGLQSVYVGYSSSASYAATGNYSVCVGYNTAANYTDGVAIGRQATSNAQNAIAIGAGANISQTTGQYAIQLGWGTNNTANTFSVGLSSSLNVQLLDSTGEIPEARMAKIIISGASDPTTATVGTVGQLYKNTTDGGIFKCTDTTGSVYTWEELGAGGSSASYDAGTKTIIL